MSKEISQQERKVLSLNVLVVFTLHGRSVIITTNRPWLPIVLKIGWFKYWKLLRTEKNFANEILWAAYQAFLYWHDRSDTIDVCWKRELESVID